jgi:hypothetical protein
MPHLVEYGLKVFMTVTPSGQYNVNTLFGTSIAAFQGSFSPGAYTVLAATQIVGGCLIGMSSYVQQLTVISNTYSCCLMSCRMLRVYVK